MHEIDFKPPGPVSRAFMRSNAFVRGLRGPVGSAKSSACTVECLRRMMGQEPDSRKLRRTRGAIIRNTNPMLKTTTMKTYKEWLPEDAFGHIAMHPPPFEQLVNLPLDDGTEIAAEVYFLALDRPEDVRKLLSLELTWAWINEARELGKTIVDGVTQRLRRYPARKDGGATWSGLWMDTNPPDEDHWWAIMSGDVEPPEDMSEEERKKLVKPDNWQFFEQPPAFLEKVTPNGIEYEVNPNAENLHNLDPEYYPGQIAGKTKHYIDTFLLNKYGAIHDGRKVHSQFAKSVHVSAEPLTPWPGVPFIVSADFGLTPAATLSQKMRGRYQTLAEVVLTDGSAVELSAAINRTMTERFPGFTIARGWGDPSGDNRGQADKNTPFQVVRAAKIPMRPCETNDPEIRRGAANAVFGKMEAGKPLVQIDPSCKVLAAGLDGAWNYKRVQGASETFHDEPVKNRYSHVCEAYEYLFVGEGEGRALVGKKLPGQATVTNVRPNVRVDPLDRFKKDRTIGAWNRRNPIR